jgi:hypothetical protein
MIGELKAFIEKRMSEYAYHDNFEAVAALAEVLLWLKERMV